MLPVIEAFMAAHQLPDVTVVAAARMISDANKRAIPDDLHRALESKSNAHQVRQIEPTRVALVIGDDARRTSPEVLIEIPCLSWV